MRWIINFMVCLCFGVTLASDDTYRAAVIHGLNSYGDIDRFLPLIHDAAKAKADILVLPSPRASSSADLQASCGIDNYDALVKILSGASKDAGIYLVAHLLEKTKCQNRAELIRSNLVFDRQGEIVSVYRKPLNNVANCTLVSSIGTFTADFGVTFGVLMEEDLVLRDEADLKGLKNFVMTGEWTSEVPFLSAAQFGTSWGSVNNANLISTAGIFPDEAYSMKTTANLVIANLKKESGEGYAASLIGHSPVPPVLAANLKSLPTEDLSMYTIRPLDLEASAKGYKETICQEEFCCDFYIKTKVDETKHEDVSYGLAVFNGVRSFSRTQNIGSQMCAVFACAGLYKRSCTLALNNTNVSFEKLSVSGNFSCANMQYPIILSDSSSEQGRFQSQSVNNFKQVTLEVENAQNILHFGVFGRDFSKDSVNAVIFNESATLYEYIFNDDVVEFFDYLWIRLRILIFIVSIYFLEMM